MRQVMPHRNNIVAQPDRCKSFLRPKTGYPLNWRALWHFGSGLTVRLEN
jgi:hypothetical protein